MLKESIMFMCSLSLAIQPITCPEHGSVPTSHISCEDTNLMTLSEDYPSAEGMTYYWGYNRYKAGDNSSGYFYYDFNAYYSNFTDVSRLYLIYVKVDFTSGWIATQNKMSGYNDKFDLDRGYVHLGAVNNFVDNGDVSSSVILLASWPASSTSVISVSSGFSANYSYNWETDNKLSWPNGVEVSTQRSTGFSLQINHSSTITTAEPRVSVQTNPNNNLEQQWNYEYQGLGKVTYTLDTFYLVEVKNDAVGFNKYGFVFDIFLNMSNVKNKIYPIRYNDSLNHSMRVYLGLGRNPNQ